jgi:SAM-dependent methyltransferase
MSSTTLFTSYDPFARIYNEFWAPKVCQKALPCLEKLLLPHLVEKAQILDLCCESGQITQQLLKKGYQVTEIDGSEEMLNYAKSNAASGKFILDDARFFKLPATFDAVVSMGALNYVMTLEELAGVFHNVYATLLEGGWFVFNVYLEEEYQSAWNGGMSSNVKDDLAWAVHQSYNPENKIGQLNITIFHLVEGSWQRKDTTILEKCYSSAEVQSVLESVGFTEVCVCDAERDLGVEKAAGNAYFVCRKPLSR